jgi:hypothetical protein
MGRCDTWRFKTIETGKEFEWTVEEILSEINRDHSEYWTNYNEHDWLEGWNEWCEGTFYNLIEGSQNVRN